MEELEEPNIVKVRVKNFLRKNGNKINDECFPVLENKFKSILLAAAKRAQSNRRKTIQVWDL